MTLTTELVELPPAFTKSRMHSLYSDFRKLAESNPEGYAANISAWKSALINVLGSSSTDRTLFPDATLISAGADLIELFESAQHGTPLALDTVIDQLVRDNTVIPYSQFLDPARTPLYHQRPWWAVVAVPTPRSVASWILAKAGVYDPDWRSAEGKVSGTLRRERYVVVPCVETLATVLLAAIKKDIFSARNPSRKEEEGRVTHGVITVGTPGGYTRSVYTKDLFYELYSQLTIPPKTLPYNKSTTAKLELDLSSSDLDVLLQYLSKDKPRLVYKDDTIKIDLSAEQVSDLAPISEKDRAVANMRGTIDAVIRKVDALSAHISACDSKARTALASKASNSRALAKYALRSRRLAQNSQESALSMLTNLETTLYSIDSATDNAGVMTALHRGVGILASLNREIGGVEKVAELMDELDEAAADTEEIGRQIGVLAASSSVNEDDVEDELQDILEQEQGRLEAHDLQTIMPSVPTAPPRTTTKEEEDLTSQMSKISLLE